jgi:hypothetical protein
LKSKDQDDPAHQPRKSDELITGYLQNLVNEKDLTQDQEKRESDQTDLSHGRFGLAPEKAKNGDQGEENAR